MSDDNRDMIPLPQGAREKVRSTVKILLPQRLKTLTPRKRYAFTLAEVLITLGIIGIVAAMTLPSVINNIHNKQLEIGLKRSASVISQALEMHQAKNGERIKQGELATSELKPILMSYLQVIEDCGLGAVDANKACIPSTTSSFYDSKLARKNKYKNFNGTNDIYMPSFDDGQFVLNDGSIILLENYNATDVADPTDGRIFISVDVNGYNKRPNRLGQDLFMFQIDEKGRFLPMGVSGTFYSANDTYCSVTSTDKMNGAGCTYKALNEKNYFKNLPK